MNMSEELKQAAHAALNACDRIVDQEESPVQLGIDFRALGECLRRALVITQDVYELPGMWDQSDLVGGETDAKPGWRDLFWALARELKCLPSTDPGANQHVFRAARALASLPTQPAAQATPEPGHPDDIAVDRFAAAMKAKLVASRAKGRGGWDDPDQCTVEHLARLLVEHIPKGDPVDVANFAMMLHQRGADRSVLSAATPEPVGEVVAIARVPSGVPGFMAEVLGGVLDQGKVKAGDKLFTRPAPGVPEIDYTALIHAAWGTHKYAQGTRGCIAFKHGAEWFRDMALAAAQAKGGAA